MRFRLMPLEERILLDAAAVVDAAAFTDIQYQQHFDTSTNSAQQPDAHDQSNVSDQSENDSFSDQSDDSDGNIAVAPEQSSEEQGPRVLVLSSDIRQADQLREAVRDDIRLVYYDSNNTSLEQLTKQISDALNGESAESIAFVGYGTEASFTLTDEVEVSLSHIMGSEELQNFWQNIGGMIRDGGSVDLLACNVAGIEEGYDLLENLNTFIDQGADSDIAVNASDDVTGNPEFGGDWQLEIGDVAADTIYFDASELQNWEGTLDVLPVMVKDINPSGASNPTELTELGDSLLFVADDGIHGKEVWISDGTESGTHILSDINGSGSSNPQDLVVIGNIAYFTADDGENGRELWQTDGTEEGTTMVADLNPGSSQSKPNYLTNVGGTLYFSAISPGTGNEIWKLDPSVGTPELIKDIRDRGSSAPRYFTEVDGTVFFTAKDRGEGYELWKTDGTEAGTVLVKDIREGNKSSSPQFLRAIGDKLFFTASNADDGREVWVSDGTESGTFMLFESRPGTQGTTAKDFVELNGKAYFGTIEGNDKELWVSDGTSEGTHQLINLKTNGSSNPQHLYVVDDTLYFSARGDTGGIELWKSDGTAEGTEMVKNLRNGNANSKPEDMFSYDGILYFSAIGDNGRELWRSDGSEEGTYQIADIRSGNQSSNPESITFAGGKIFFAADDGIHGDELFAMKVVNEPPVILAPSELTISEDDPLIFDDTNAIVISDSDAGVGEVEVTIGVTNGTLTLGDTAGLTLIKGDGNDDITLQFRGSLPNVNAALAGASFTPTENFSGSGQLHITVNDLGAEGIGDPQTTVNSVDITINAQNDAPFNSVPGVQQVSEDGSITFSAANGNAITVSDMEGYFESPLDGSGLSSQELNAIRLTNITGLIGPNGENVMRVRNPLDSALLYQWQAVGGARLDSIAPPGDSYFLVPAGSTVKLFVNDQQIEVKASSFGPDPQPFNPPVIGGNASLEVTLTPTNGAITLADHDNVTITRNEDGTISVEGLASEVNAALDGLVFTPDSNFSGKATIRVVTDDLGNFGGPGSLTDTDDIIIEVTPIADTPLLSVEPAFGNQDSDIALTIQSSLIDQDNSEALSLVISDIPSGATLSDGTNSFTASEPNQSVDISTWNLDAITITPTPGSDTDFILTITATATEQANADQAQETLQLPVTVATVEQGSANLVLINNDLGSFTFTPNVIGADGLTFQTTDGRLISASFDIAKGSPEDLGGGEVPDPMQQNALVDGSAQVIKGPDKGVLQIHSDGSFTYSPGEGLVGIDSATIRLIRGNEVTEVEFIIQIIKPKYLDENTSFDTTRNAAIVAEGLAKGALTMPPAAAASTAKGHTQIIVRHEDTPDPDTNEALPVTPESDSTSAQTVAAFAISSNPDDFPVTEYESDNEEEGSTGLFNGFMKDLFTRKSDGNDGVDGFNG